MDEVLETRRKRSNFSPIEHVDDSGNIVRGSGYCREAE